MTSLRLALTSVTFAVRPRTRRWKLGLASLVLFVGAGLVGTPEAAAQEDDLLPPGIVHEPCEFYKKRRNFEIIARFYDDSPIFDPKVIYRTRSRRWKSASFKKMPGGKDFKATLKKRKLKGVLEYFIEVFDENGNGPARYGSPEAPVRVRPSRKLVECIQVPEEEEEAMVEEPTAVDESDGSTGGVMSGSTEDDGLAPSSEAGSASDTPMDDGLGDDGLSDDSMVDSGGDSGSGAYGDSGDSSAGGGTETIEASSGEGDGSSVIEPPPEPAKTGCDAEDAPLYCSPVLWGVIGGTLAAATGTVLGVYFGVVAPGQDPRDPRPPPLPDSLTLTIRGPDPTGAL